MTWLAVWPVCDECASSAMTANRFPARPLFSRIASSANGKVWIVTTMMRVPLSSSAASTPDFDVSPALRMASSSMVAT